MNQRKTERNQPANRQFLPRFQKFAASQKQKERETTNRTNLTNLLIRICPRFIRQIRLIRGFSFDATPPFPVIPKQTRFPKASSTLPVFSVIDTGVVSDPADGTFHSQNRDLRLPVT